ncbi:PilC/PilY family type IV pilus protein [Candidatus Thioglobus sp.]|nr:PilC/PilY family type IV pilus protein [Candidatus Thioglobus sp.]MDB9863816.1 PilC/PilY family type IV pilus protein [Candidatus Thioglobus sp.]MDC1450570.1 PilC/PilY family type IV pilus protein [Candidatus Thioglobus sp.]
MKKLQIIISFLLFIFAFSIEAKSPPPGTGKADVPANIYIMLDTSGSMRGIVNSQGRMYYPRDVAIDSNGNIYVVEYYYHRIRKYDSAGNFVKTFGSYGRNSNGRFYYPHKIDIDSNDNLYIADRYRIQKFNANGSWMKSFPNLSGIRNVAVDSSGNVFATNARDIYKWNSAGVSQGGFSCGQDCRGLSEYNGTIYATDQGSRPQSVKKWNASTFAPSGSFSVTRNSYPQEIEVTSKGIYVSNSLNSVQKYSLSGVYSKQFGSSSIYGFGSDSSNNIYIADFYRHAIKKYDSDGNYLSTAGPSSETRMTEVLKVIEKLTSSSDLTKAANFGLQDWSSSAVQRVPISINGAATINKYVTPKITINGVEKTNPDYKTSWWYPNGGTELDRAMKEAQSYFSGSKSPIDAKASCQKNFLIVISDGQWWGSQAENIAKNMLATKGIQTLVIGFHATGSQANYIKLAKAGGTYPESPLFSNNWQQLYETMSAYIRQAISSRLTFSAPVVMPNISSGDHIFQSTFEYKNDHQWKGQLAKFALTATGDVGAQKWEAGALLDQKSESSRQIWTVANSFGVNHSLNNFKTFYAADLGRAFSENSGTNPTTVQTNKLINFVRGLDAYDEDADNDSSEQRWKLGDIYNSRLIVVGSPKARTTDKLSKSDTVAYYRHLNGYDNFKKGNTCGGSCLTRKEVVYVGANDGMLHAFDSTTGEELWAFIPPTMLQDLDKMVSVKANKSISIYGVDGSPIAKDIFYDNKWRTVLFSGMGKGGKGYFALDITNPTSPTFLFAFENKASMDLIYHWDSSGTRTDLGYAGGIAAEYDYSKLGEALSTPVIVAMPDGNSTKWVAVFGAGYNAGISTKYGSSIYVVDLEEDGKVLKRIDLADANSSNSIVNSMPADLVSITPDTTSKANYKGSMVYGADLEGKMWKLNLTNKETLYEITSTFNAEATLDNDRSVFFQVTPSMGSDNKLWNFYGTGNQQRLQTLSSSINNRIFGIKDSKFPVYENVNGLTTTAQSSLKNMSTPGGTCPTTNDLGWYVNLGSNERITGKLALFNETIYATKYKPNQGAICSPGTAYLDELSMGCGKVNRTTNLGEGIATGAVIFKNKIYVGISGSGSGDLKDDQGKVVGKKVNNIIVINPAAGNTVGGGNITQESWREIF